MKTLNSLFAFLLVAAVFTACERPYDEPPVQEIPEGDILTLGQLKGLYSGSPIKFVGDTSIYVVVTADESSGNFYKEVYVSDTADALNVRLLSSGGLYQGDKIRINLKGCVLSEYNGVMQLDSVNVDDNVVKIETNVNVEPMLVTVDQISPLITGHLVRLEGVQFNSSEWGLTYADAVNLQSENRMLEDCSGNQVIVRTSGYADFAGDPIPTGNGSLIAIVGEFNGDMQLYIRDPQEVNLTGAGCVQYVNEDFEGGSLTANYAWSVYDVMPSTSGLTWVYDNFSGNNFAEMTNYNFGTSSNEAVETWLISPAIDLSSGTAPELIFDNVKRYTGNNIELLISTDYDGTSDPSIQGTWTDITSLANLDANTGSWSFVSSGSIDISAYMSSTTYIAFKYADGNTQGATWEIDNVLIREQ